ncbi:hypothetical protein EDB83DRAFT_2324263 [Lactarius deliciosus]|nr:hypothetical protein EDB83DRAFT_2324263 [Lactarius deliciosus]
MSHGPRNWFEQTPAGQSRRSQENAINGTDSQENTVKIDEQENAKTLTCIMAASGNQLDPDSGKQFLNPLNKYTKGPMPDIHDEDPATLLKGLNKSQIRTWLKLTTGKVLTRPFNSDVNFQKNHQHIAKVLMATAKEITGSASIAVAPPDKDHSSHKQQSKHHPNTFLIHGMSKRDAETLLKWKTARGCRDEQGGAVADSQQMTRGYAGKEGISHSGRHSTLENS